MVVNMSGCMTPKMAILPHKMIYIIMHHFKLMLNLTIVLLIWYSSRVRIEIYIFIYDLLASKHIMGVKMLYAEYNQCYIYTPMVWG